jgi:OOP family OmpA-OmpF porin
MKRNTQTVVLAGICASALCATSAQAQLSRFYIGADAGGLLTSDTRVKEFVGPVAGEAKMKLDPGVRFGFRAGYHFTDWFALEGETGVLANNIHSISGGSIDGNADLANFPFLLNARFEIPHGKCPVTPYFGGGAGGSWTFRNFEHHVDFNGAEVSGHDSARVFAYQAFGGLRYAISDNMGLGVEYHYFCTTGPQWGTDGGGDIALSGARSHAITLAFDFHF